MRHLFLSMLLFAFSHSYAQSTFYRSLDYDGDLSWGMQVVEKENGFVGIVLENCDGKVCTHWLDIDQEGWIQDRFYLTDTLFSVSGTNPGSYLNLVDKHFVTTTITYPNGVIEALISSIDTVNQSIIWTRGYGEDWEDVPTRLQPGHDGNMIAYQSTRLSENPFTSITNLLKIDTTGETVWQTSIGIPNNYNIAFNHLPLPDGDHLTFHAACEPDVYCQDFLVGYGLYATKVDTAGQELWSQELRRGHYTRWNGTDPVLMNDGLVALNWIHDTFPLPAGEVRFQDMLIWMDQDGEIVRESFFPRDRERNIRAMTKAANGDLLGAGSVDLSGLELGRGGYVFRMAPDGTLLWERYLADVRFPIDSHFFNDVIEAEDGGIVLTGLLRDSFPNNDPFDFNPNVWLVKLDSTGCLEPGCSLFQVMGATVDTESPPPAEEAALLLYPNPTATFAHLQWPADAAVRYPLDVSVVDLTGRPVLQRTFSAAPVVLQCRNWPAGYYVVRVRDRDGRAWVEKLVVN